jgi:hypothetical protein
MGLASIICVLLPLVLAWAGIVNTRSNGLGIKLLRVTTHLGAQPGNQNEPEQRDWNKRLRQAREKMRDLERRADLAEIETNRLRNFLFGAEPRTSKTHNQTVSQIAELSRLIRRLRAESVIVQAEAEAILEEGVAKGFKVQAISPTKNSGEPNPEYYRVRVPELQADLRDSQIREQVLHLRINELKRRITVNSGTGDNFFIGRLRDELQQTERGLEQTRARIGAISMQLDELIKAARAAGIKPELPK